jgi:hypothetical protein
MERQPFLNRVLIHPELDSIRTIRLESLWTYNPLMINAKKLQEFVYTVQDKQDSQFNLLINRLDQIIELLQQQENTYMATLQDITDAVTAQTTVDNSIITLLSSVVTQLNAAIALNDPVAVQAVVNSIQANTASLAAAVLANTPVVVVPSGTAPGAVISAGTVTTVPSTGVVPANAVTISGATTTSNTVNPTPTTAP